MSVSRVSNQVSDMSGSGEIPPEWFNQERLVTHDPIRNPQRKDGGQKTNHRRQGSITTVACSLGAASLLLKKKRKLSMGEKSTSAAENVTLLPELAATEMIRCVDTWVSDKVWSGTSSEI